MELVQQKASRRREATLAIVNAPP